MKHINVYINEAWSGVKQQSIKADIESWCDEMGIKNYTINSKGEIDVDGNVWLYKKNDFKELPYKFGVVTGYFDMSNNRNLKSLKNCPNIVDAYFSCSKCPKLDSLEGCPKEVDSNFYCYDCKVIFDIKEIEKLCKIHSGSINN